MGKVDAWLTRKGLRRIELWAQAGYSDAELSHLMDVSRKTFYKWLKEHEAIGDSLTRGRAHAADVVEDELFKRTRGQVVKLTKYVKVRQVEYDPMSGRKLREFEELEPVEEEIYVPADVRAQTYFLNCRRPEDWGEKQTLALDARTAEALRQPTLTVGERTALLEELKAVADHGGEE